MLKFCFNQRWQLCSNFLWYFHHFKSILNFWWQILKTILKTCHQFNHKSVLNKPFPFHSLHIKCNLTPVKIRKTFARIFLHLAKSSSFRGLSNLSNFQPFSNTDLTCSLVNWCQSYPMWCTTTGWLRWCSKAKANNIYTSFDKI